MSRVALLINNSVKASRSSVIMDIITPTDLGMIT